MGTMDHDSESLPNEPGWTDSGEPYRTPEAVPDQSRRRGLLASPLTWLLTGAVVVGAVAFAFASRKTEQNAVQAIEEFGYTRSGPIEEPDYEQVMATESVEDTTGAP